MEENLNELIRLFYEDKQQLDKYKKSTDEYNKEIKEDMSKLGIDNFKTDNGLVAKLSVQNRESFIEPNLITKLKELNLTTPIKTVEVIDYDILEDLIYNGKLDASILSEFKETKQVITLKVTEKQIKGDE